MNHTRYILLYLLLSALLCLLPMDLYAKASPIDSLQTLLAHTPDPQKRIKILINLDDYCRNVSGKPDRQTTYTLLNEALRAKNEYAIARTLRRLLMDVDRRVRSFDNDSVVRYLALGQQHLTGENRQCFLTEVRLRQIRQAVDWTENEALTTADLMKRYTVAQQEPEDLYHRIEREYVLGKVTSFMLSGEHTDAQESQSYFDRLLELIQQLPVEHRGPIFLYLSDSFFVTYFNANAKAKAVKMLQRMMSTMKEYQALYQTRGEVYENYTYERGLYYEGMARCPEIVGKEASYRYLLKCRSLTPGDDESMMTLYYTYRSYYKSLGDHRHNILYCDSIIEVTQRLNFPEAHAVAASLYKEQAESYAHLHEYDRAYQRLLHCNSLQDSVANADSDRLKQEMTVRYNVNQLELEAARLESRNGIIALVSSCIFLLLSVAWGVHQRISYKKLKRVQQSLLASNAEVIRQSEKAQESEKMKTAFINSMCHEIRTPLNSINGFSSLLLDDSIDNELKVDFPEMIQRNTDQLTRLINDLLEVSGLDSSLDALPVESVNLYSLCREELDNLQRIGGKASIDYRLEMDEADSVIHSHQRYLIRVLGNLLDNANKFTDQGSITVSGRRNVAGGEYILTVTDTGVGVPTNKQEWVFDRFTKIDEFRSGTGLGLYVCRLILHRLHGSIRIDPEYVGGTRFILTIRS